MSSDKLAIQAEKLKALQRKLSIAKASYKTAFLFAGKRLTVAEAERTIEFLTTQINNNDNEKDNPES